MTALYLNTSPKQWLVWQKWSSLFKSVYCIQLFSDKTKEASPGLHLAWLLLCQPMTLPRWERKLEKGERLIGWNEIGFHETTKLNSAQWMHSAHSRQKSSPQEQTGKSASPAMVTHEGRMKKMGEARGGGTRNPLSSKCPHFRSMLFLVWNNSAACLGQLAWLTQSCYWLTAYELA